MKRDKDGFVVLERKDPTLDIATDIILPDFTKSSQKGGSWKKQKGKLPKFKKKSWKYRLLRSLRKWKSGPSISKFHRKNLKSYLIHNVSATESVKHAVAMIAPGGFDLSTQDWHTIANKSDKEDGGVFVPIGNGNYTKVSFKTYRKLQKINKVGIHFKLTAMDDGDNEAMDIDEFDDVYDNMNSLLGFIEYHRQCVIGIYEIQARCCWYTYYQFKFKIMVWDINNKVTTYTDLNDFMSDYGLYLI